MRGLLSGMVMIMFALLPAQAGETNVLSGPILRELMTDNTVTGRYDNGESYSEYHAPDGRVFGHNNREPNENACWDLRQDMVCYYYAKGRAKGEFCWAIEALPAQGIRARLLKDNSQRTIIGIVQAGNPHGHSDNGKPWSCDPLSSENSKPHDSRTRHAAR